MGWKQDAVQRAVVSVYGCGGIGSQILLAGLKYGVRCLHAVDHDFVEVSNLNRQLFQLEDVGQPKAHALVRRLAPHGVMGSELHGHPMYCQEFFERFSALRPDAGVVGVDNDSARLAAARHHLAIARPVICIALRDDAGGGLVFVQEPSKACLGCYMGSVLGKRKAPCPGAPAVFDCCQVVCGYAAYALTSLLTKRPRSWNVLTIDLAGGETRAHVVPRRRDCPLCSRV